MHLLKRRVAFTSIFLLLGSMACVPIPIPAEEAFPEESTQFVTKDDVVSTLGRPLSSNSNADIFVFRKYQNLGAVISLEIIPRTYGRNQFLVLKFDQKNRLIHRAVVSRVSDYCFSDGSCLVSASDLDLRTAPKEIEDEAKQLRADPKGCAVYIFSGRPWLLGRGQRFQGYERILLDGEERFRFVNVEASNHYDVGGGTQSGTPMNRLADYEHFYRLDMRPGAHRLQYSSQMPSSPLATIGERLASSAPAAGHSEFNFVCPPGQILFIGPTVEKASDWYGWNSTGFRFLPSSAANKIGNRNMLLFDG